MACFQEITQKGMLPYLIFAFSFATNTTTTSAATFTTNSLRR